MLHFFLFAVFCFPIRRHMNCLEIFLDSSSFPLLLPSSTYLHHQVGYKLNEKLPLSMSIRERFVGSARLGCLMMIMARDRRMSRKLLQMLSSNWIDRVLLPPAHHPPHIQVAMMSVVVRLMTVRYDKNMKTFATVHLSLAVRSCVSAAAGSEKSESESKHRKQKEKLENFQGLTSCEWKLWAEGERES